jgi:hypothetical protein
LRPTPPFVPVAGPRSSGGSLPRSYGSSWGTRGASIPEQDDDDEQDAELLLLLTGSSRGAGGPTRSSVSYDDDADDYADGAGGDEEDELAGMELDDGTAEDLRKGVAGIAVKAA